MHFRFEQTIALPRARVFAFHEDPENLVLLHREWSTFRIISHDGPLHEGSLVWVETTIAGILPIVMGFENDLYEPPHRFGEHLFHGPFSKFEHIHEFDEAGTATVVRDLLEIELPRHYGGEVAMKVLIARTLRRAFRSRGAALLRLAEAGEIG